MSEIALRTPTVLQRGASKRFPRMLKNTPRAHQKCLAFLSALRCQKPFWFLSTLKNL